MWVSSSISPKVFGWKIIINCPFVCCNWYDPSWLYFINFILKKWPTSCLVSWGNNFLFDLDLILYSRSKFMLLFSFLIFSASISNPIFYSLMSLCSENDLWAELLALISGLSSDILASVCTRMIINLLKVDN